MKAIIAVALIAVAMLGGALVMTQPTQAQEFPTCDPAALEPPCQIVHGDLTCFVFERSGACIIVPPPAPGAVAAPAAPLGPLPATTGDPQPGTDEHGWPPPPPFGPGGER